MATTLPMGTAERVGRRCGGESGTSLIFAMAFLALTSGAVVSILIFTFANFKVTTVAHEVSAKAYGADGGIEIGVHLLRVNPSYCAAGTTTVENLPNQTINGRTIGIACQGLGSVWSGGGEGSGRRYALIATGYPGPTGSPSNLANSVDTSTSNSAQHGDLRFGGPAFTAGGFNPSGNGVRLVFEQTLDQYDAPSPYCTIAQATSAGSDDPHVNGAWTCRQPSDYPVPDPLPSLKVPTLTAHASTTSGICTTLYPGKYTSAPAFSSSKQYYFASGVYYFENADLITLDGQVFGGAPGAGQVQAFTDITPCSNDAAANATVPGSATGSGVELVLGGTSRLTVGNSTSTNVELFAREPGDPALEGTPGISIYAPRTAGTGYLAWNSTFGLDLPNAKPQVVIHGQVYSPNAPLSVLIVTNANAGNSAIFGGGVVVQALAVKTTGSQAFSSLYLAGPLPFVAPTSRLALITAVAEAPEGGVSTTVRAMVEFALNGASQPTILSWRKI